MWILHEESLRKNGRRLVGDQKAAMKYSPLYGRVLTILQVGIRNMSELQQRLERKLLGSFFASCG